MKTRTLIAALVLCTFALPLRANSQFQSTGDPDLDARLISLVQGSFLKFNCDVPGIQPKVCTLQRGSSPNVDQVVKTLLGDEENIIARQPMTSPLWGKGTRIKAGTVLYATADGYKPQPSGTPGKKIELVPAFLDTFSSGYVYVNNIPHKPVYATNVVYDNAKPPKVSYHKVYGESDGRLAAKQLVDRMLGELKAPKGFLLTEKDYVQTEDERLYVYKAYPEYITSFAVFSTGKDGKPNPPVEQPVSIPVLDGYVEVQLDGEKLLCSLENFWDSGLSASGSPQECIQAAQAVLNARDWLMKRYKNNPPLMTVDGIRLGFIQDRSNRAVLIPVWLFDCGHTQRVREEMAGGKGASESVMRISEPFAVNALTGECIGL